MCNKWNVNARTRWSQTFLSRLEAVKSGACDMVLCVSPSWPPPQLLICCDSVGIWLLQRCVCVCVCAWRFPGLSDPSTDHKAPGGDESRHCEGHHVGFWSCDHQRVTYKLHIKDADCQKCVCVCVCVCVWMHVFSAFLFIYLPPFFVGLN